MLGRWLLLAIAMFVLLNALLLLAEDRTGNSPIGRYGMERFAQAHPGWNEDDLETLDRESFGDHLRLRYHPFAAFRNPEATGQFVNVAPAGYRQSRELPWPPAPDSCSIFLFGGSTAFGLALSDEESLGAALDEEIRARAGDDCAVYNFSVPAHFSSNEQGLFLDLVREGVGPQLAIFVDGINDFAYPDGRPEMYYFLDHVVSRRSRWDFVTAMPVMRWIRAARAVMTTHDAAPGDAERVEQENANRSAERWRANVSLTAGAAASRGIRTLFVIQPSPAYGYDLRHHLFAEGDFERLGNHRAAALGYEVLKRLNEEAPVPVETLWLTDLQRGREENLYVDMVHYTAAFTRDIAREIAVAAVNVLRRPVSPERKTGSGTLLALPGS